MYPPLALAYVCGPNGLIIHIAVRRDIAREAVLWLENERRTCACGHDVISGKREQLVVRKQDFREFKTKGVKNISNDCDGDDVSCT